MVSAQLREASEQLEATVGAEGKYGVGVVAAGLAVIGRDRPKVAGGLALVLAGIGLIAYGGLSRFMESMGLA
ncbi:DUF7470 family protein [Halovenus halobia]|jgi:hypothetical protein|uniref:DUF7470 family protein n=1 Tax=Halovenus halobia TaxID=3396622 RepID=UPI003F55AA92